MKKVFLIILLLINTFVAGATFKSFEAEDVAIHGRIRSVEIKWLHENAEELKTQVESLSSKKELYILGSDIFRRVGLCVGGKTIVGTSQELRWVVPSDSISSMKETLIKTIDQLTQDIRHRRSEAEFFKTEQQGNFQPLPSDNEEIEIIHGGGLQYILDFLKGNIEGYALEGESRTKGLQVHPFYEKTEEMWTKLKKRSLDTYAVQLSLPHLDFPAILQARIHPKYLERAPNFYEAGIRSCFRNCLKDITILIITDADKESSQERLITEVRRPYMKSSLKQEYYDRQNQLTFLDLAI